MWSLGTTHDTSDTLLGVSLGVVSRWDGPPSLHGKEAPSWVCMCGQIASWSQRLTSE